MYRRIKARSAEEGRTVRSITLVLYSQWLGDSHPEERRGSTRRKRSAKPAWFGGGAAGERQRLDAGRALAQVEEAEVVRGGGGELGELEVGPADPPSAALELARKVGPDEAAGSADQGSLHGGKREKGKEARHCGEPGTSIAATPPKINRISGFAFRGAFC